MKLTVIIPHYAVGKITAYTISQLLKYKGHHDLKIIVVDNKTSDGSHKYLLPFGSEITYVAYPEDLLQSHGISISWAIQQGYVDTEYVLCLENDAFPVKEFVSYYEQLANDGYDAAGSILKLSGGAYLHPCAAMYKVSVIREAEAACKAMPYYYFPNMAMKDGFAYHLMVHKTAALFDSSVAELFLKSPESFIDLADGYTPFSAELAKKKWIDYLPTVCAFHNGMGGNQESVHTYGNRSIHTDVDNILADKMLNKKIIYRVGYEPGEWLYFWMLKMGKKIFEIPTEMKWMPGRENQQQEYSITESNIHHVWGVSSYTERPAEGVEDIYSEKRGLPDKLYSTLPKHQRID